MQPPQQLVPLPREKLPVAVLDMAEPAKPARQLRQLPGHGVIIALEMAGQGLQLCTVILEVLPLPAALGGIAEWI